MPCSQRPSLSLTLVKADPQPALSASTLCYTLLCHPKCSVYVSVAPQDRELQEGRAWAFLFIVITPTPAVPKAWFLKPGVGFPLAPLTALCFSADVISGFLLIIMLFFISVSLLIGVVKVRALLGEGKGTRAW